ncbi:glycosyltransferase family 4 protein [Synechococcus sp. CBW1004]|jgi:glycosyltransferase involved in cell wall biosynthesis|uniref:glycosyltransferase family 4 protein n=1 Tax=Synechococcus sp. CBW1004 TaxID=1353136 RepID=UPI0018CD81A0|nr:glycosyltransferase family 4 protein [Synechococcus sp. CBW1004]QPN64715.1 glycosyltransferase family 4 protein [Synechococcus sp. CBW1004]
MRLLLFSPHFPPYGSGGPTVIDRLARGLLGLGHEVLVVTTQYTVDLPDQDLRHGVQVRRFPFWEAVARPTPTAMAAGLHWLADQKRSFRPDVVHLCMVSPIDLFHWQSRSAAPVPTVVTLHGELEPSLCRPLRPGTVFDHALRRADALVACSRAVQADLLEVLPAAAGRSLVIPNGMEPPPRQAAPVSISPPELLCVARLVAGKGVDIALRAFAEIRAALPEARFTIAGDGHDRPRLEQLAEHLGVSRSVRFLGWKRSERCLELMEASSLLLVSSLSEGFGLTALEAAWMRRPVVASRTGGLVEVVEHGVTGLLVTPGDAGEMAAAALELLQDLPRCRNFGDAAQQRARELFALDRQVGAYATLYARLASRHSG